MRTHATLIISLLICLAATGCGKSDTPTPIVANQLSPYCVPGQSVGFGGQCQAPTTVDQFCLGRGVVVTVDGQAVCRMQLTIPVGIDTGYNTLLIGSTSDPHWPIPAISGISLQQGDQVVISGSSKWSSAISTDLGRVADFTLLDPYGNDIVSAAPGVATEVPYPGVAAYVGVAATGIKSYHFTVDSVRVLRCQTIAGTAIACPAS
jgi:hypothetical protein